MVTNQRKTVSRAELNAWLTLEIRKVKDCGDASLEVKYLLTKPDEDGCNWSGLIAKPGKRITADQIGAIAAEIGKRARQFFNLAE